MSTAHLLLVRDTFTDKSTIGKLTLEGTHICDILEDTDRQLESNPKSKVYGETAIPRGTYEVVLTYSPRFKKILPLLLKVPGYEGVRIHTGNKPEDTDGCLIVGERDQSKPNYVINSRSALDRFKEVFSNFNKITLEIK